MSGANRASSRCTHRWCVVAVCAFAFLLLGNALHAAPPSGAGWALVWNDEFTGTTLDTAKWRQWLPGARRDAVNSPSVVAVSGGNLVLSTYTSGSTHYTGMVSTESTYLFTYGYVEARIDYNDSPGMWSAFWMQSPTMGNPIGSPNSAGTEIDICEHRKVNNAVASPVSQRSEFLILSSEVDETSTTWAGAIPGGGYGSLAATTTNVKVDYVRVYQRAETVVNGDFEGQLAPFGATNQGSWSSTGGRTDPAAGKIAPTSAAGASVQQTVRGLMPATDYTLTGWGDPGTVSPRLDLGVKSHGGGLCKSDGAFHHGRDESHGVGFRLRAELRLDRIRR